MGATSVTGKIPQHLSFDASVLRRISSKSRTTSYPEEFFNTYLISSAAVPRPEFCRAKFSKS